MSVPKRPAQFAVAVDHDPAKAPCLCLEFGGGWARATVRTGASAAATGAAATSAGAATTSASAAAEYWPSLEANLAHLAAQMTLAKLEPAPIDGHADAGVLDLLVKYKIVRGASSADAAAAATVVMATHADAKSGQSVPWLESAKPAKHQPAEFDNEVQRVTKVVKAYMHKYGATPSLTDASVVGIAKVNNYIKSAANCPRATDDFLARVRALL